MAPARPTNLKTEPVPVYNMMIMCGPVDTHDGAAMGTIVDNIKSMLKEKTMMHTYKDNKHCNMGMDTDREHNKYKGLSLSAHTKDITHHILLRVYTIQSQN